MNILIRYTLKNIKEKKFRLVLILFSITLSTALFFASAAIGRNIETIFAAQMKSLFGDSDIRINTDETRQSNFFYEASFREYESKTEYMVGGFFGYASYETKDQSELPLYLVGYELEDMAKFNPVQLIQQSGEGPFDGRDLIIGMKMADDQGLRVGDSIELEAFGRDRIKFTVWGIAADQGVFKSSGERTNVMMSKDTVARMAGVPGRVNSLLMKVPEGGNVQTLVDEINDSMPGYNARESLPMDEIRQNIAQVSSLFNIMLILVLLISVFIIYTSFKVIMMERIPIIGTFRSVGATKGATNLIMLGESIFYGLVGGILGDLLGIGVLYGMTSVMAYDPYSGTTTAFKLTFSPMHLLAGVMMAVILSLISSLIPVIQVSKIPVKDIVLNKTEKQSKKGYMKYIIGYLLMAVSVALPIMGFTKGNMVLNVLLMVTAIVGLVMTVPQIIKASVLVMSRFFGKTFGNEGLLAVKNINDNKNVVNNIVLLTIGIASLFLINVISYSIGVEVINVYNSGKFEVWAWVNDMDAQNLRRVKAVEDVVDVHGTYETYGINVVGTDQQLNSITGINPYTYFDYWEYEILGDREEIIRTLDSGQHMILNKSMAEKFDVDVGDTMTFEMNGREKTYTITGLVVTLMNNGQMGLISDKYYKADFEPDGYTDVFIRTDGDAQAVNDRILEKFKDRGVWARTVDDLQQSNTESNNQILVLLQGFSVLTMVIGIFGVFNNYIVNMLSRKRSLAMYRSVGMGMKQMRKMLYLESFSGGVIGGIMGLAGGLLFIFMVGYVMRSMNMPVAMHINPIMAVQSVIGGIIVSVIASISPVLRSSKMQIIEALKYE